MIFWIVYISMSLMLWIPQPVWCLPHTFTHKFDNEDRSRSKLYDRWV